MTTVAAVTVTLVAVVVAAWSLTDARRARARIDSELAARDARIDELASEVQAMRDDDPPVRDDDARGAVEELTREQRRLRHQVRRQRFSLAHLRSRMRMQSRAAFTLKPPGTEVTEVAMLRPRGGQPRRAVVAWSANGLRTGSPRFGLTVWEPDAGPASATTAWRSAWAVSVNAETGVAVVRTAGGTQIEDARDLDRVGVVMTRDVTGDGYDEVVTMEGNSGSGGCGTWRVLGATGSSFRQLFRRQACETHVTITRGMLRVDSATYGKSCEAAHGCGSKRTWMRWNGSGWDVVRQTRQSYGY